MGPIISLLIIVSFSFLVVRVGTLALVMTGLERSVAVFQACSAFFGVGFTTREAEMVLAHPARRRIVTHLILIGNVGLLAGAGSIVVAFVKAGNTTGELGVLLWIALGVLVLWLFSATPPVRMAIDWSIRQTLKSAGVIRPADFALILRIQDGFVVEDVTLHKDSYLVGITLRQSALSQRGVIVLGCTRLDEKGREQYIGAPSGKIVFQAEDRLTVYGKQDQIENQIRPHGHPTTRDQTENKISRHTNPKAAA